VGMAKLPAFWLIWAGFYESHTAHEGRMYLANSVRQYFQGEMVNPLKEQIVFKHSNNLHLHSNRQSAVYTGGTSTFKRHTSLLGETLLAVILINSIGWRVKRLSCWGCLVPEVPQTTTETSPNSEVSVQCIFSMKESMNNRLSSPYR
jgi:hypothetical protein